MTERLLWVGVYGGVASSVIGLACLIACVWIGATGGGWLSDEVFLWQGRALAFLAPGFVVGYLCASIGHEMEKAEKKARKRAMKLMKGGN